MLLKGGEEADRTATPNGQGESPTVGTGKRCIHIGLLIVKHLANAPLSSSDDQIRVCTGIHQKLLWPRSFIKLSSTIGTRIALRGLKGIFGSCDCTVASSVELRYSTPMSSSLFTVQVLDRPCIHQYEYWVCTLCVNWWHCDSHSGDLIVVSKSIHDPKGPWG